MLITHNSIWGSAFLLRSCSFLLKHILGELLQMCLLWNCTHAQLFRIWNCLQLPLAPQGKLREASVLPLSSPVGVASGFCCLWSRVAYQPCPCPFVGDVTALTALGVFPLSLLFWNFNLTVKMCISFHFSCWGFWVWRFIWKILSLYPFEKCCSFISTAVPF